jgi:creatinine amidohydrolase
MRLDMLSWPEVQVLPNDVVALLPIAATEQHGRHLPLQVDRRLTQEIADRLEVRRKEWLVLAPVVWFGASEHHLRFAGTLSVPNTLYIDLLMAMISSLLNAGFRRIVLLNGHGGNISSMTEALVRTRHRLGSAAPVHLVGCTYWSVAGGRMAREAGMETPNITHACEYETSMMLYLEKDLVHLDRAVVDVPEWRSDFFDIHEHRPSRAMVALNMDQYTASGAMGRPQAATAEKGRKVLDVIVDEVGKFLDEFRHWPFIPAGRSAENAKSDSV